MTVLFKSTPGSRRWQHTVGSGSAEDCGYTVILGSNRNRCLKIERDGQTCAQARPPEVPCASPQRAYLPVSSVLTSSHGSGTRLTGFLAQTCRRSTSRGSGLASRSTAPSRSALARQAPVTASAGQTRRPWLPSGTSDSARGTSTRPTGISSCTRRRHHGQRPPHWCASSFSLLSPEKSSRSRHYKLPLTS